MTVLNSLVVFIRQPKGEQSFLPLRLLEASFDGDGMEAFNLFTRALTLIIVSLKLSSVLESELLFEQVSKLKVMNQVMSLYGHVSTDISTIIASSLAFGK